MTTGNVSSGPTVLRDATASAATYNSGEGTIANYSNVFAVQAGNAMTLKSYLTVSQLVNKYLKNPYLRKAFSIHPLLVGGDPHTTTSIYALIHYLEDFTRWVAHRLLFFA